MADPKKSAVRVLGARIDATLADRMHAFCRDHAGKPLYLSVNKFVEQAIAAHLDTLQDQVNDLPQITASRADPSRNGLVAGRRH
jgi:hypothetical protein